MSNARITVATSSCKLRFMQRLAPWLCLYAALSASPTVCSQLNGRLDEISGKVEVLRLQAGPPVISYNPHVFTDHVEMETSGKVGLRGIETVAGRPQPPCLPSKRSQTEVAGDANFGAALLPAHGAAMLFATAPGTAA